MAIKLFCERCSDRAVLAINSKHPDGTRIKCLTCGEIRILPPLKDKMKEGKK